MTAEQAGGPGGRPWDRFLTERDRAVYAASGYGWSGELRMPAALLVIDMTFDFLGDRPEPIMESIRRYPNSCGQRGWAAAERLAPVLAAARGSGAPVVYTARGTEHLELERLAWGAKNTASAAATAGDAAPFPDVIAPEPGDAVIHKTKPSAFFDTPLIEYLVSYGIRQVVCAGATTSGCVRASVVDAFSYGFRVAVVEECTADRGELAHAVNLFDMQQKYADVITAERAAAFFAEGATVSTATREDTDR